jgi:Flp pilus assembly protein TadG
MKMKKTSSPSRQHAQSLVEMALGLMVVLWLLSGAVDFGVGFYSYVAIRDAAQEGALYGSINPTGDIAARVRASSASPVNLTNTTNVHVTVTLPSPACAGHQLTVGVVYDYPIMMALTSIITGPVIHIRSSATSTLLLPPCS